jgi:hypothetical protein
MPDDTTADKAQASLDAALSQGVSISEGNLSVTRASVRDALAVLDREEDKTATRAGRRPLFRGFNLSGMQG